MSVPSRVASILELLVQKAKALEKLPVLRVPTEARYPEETRRLLSTGSRKAVDKITVGEVVAVQEEILKNSAAITLYHAGHLMQAPDVVKDVLKKDDPFVGTVTKRLFDYATSLGGTVLDANSSLLGDNKIGGVKATVDERTLRLTKAVLTMVAELQVLGIDAGLLLEERFLPQALEFIRGFITRYGTSAGLRFEFRQAAELDAVLRPLVDGLELQLYIPKLTQQIVGKGPDAFAYLNDLAFAMQFKSSLDLAGLLGGCAQAVKNRKKLITKVKGTEVARQTLADLIRLVPWNYRIPLPGLNWGSMSPPPTASSRALAQLRIVVVDDTRYLDMLFAEIGWAIRDGSMRTQGGINVLDVGALRGPVQATIAGLLEPVVGTSRVIPLDDVAGLRAVAQSQVSRVVAGLETGLNERLAPVISSTLGGLVHEVKVVTATDAPSRIPALLGAFPPPLPLRTSP